jgi:hypothetical protein
VQSRRLLPAGWLRPFFFLRARCFCRPSPANSRAQFHKFTAQLLISAKLLDFSFGFLDRGVLVQTLALGLSFDLIGDSPMRTMSGMVRLLAATFRFSALPLCRCQRSRPQISKGCDLLKNFGALTFQCL